MRKASAKTSPTTAPSTTGGRSWRSPAAGRSSRSRSTSAPSSSSRASPTSTRITTTGAGRSSRRRSTSRSARRERRSATRSAARPARPLRLLERPLGGLARAVSGVALQARPTPEWTDEEFAELSSLDIVEVADLKGAYHGTGVDNPADPSSTSASSTAFPRSWIEDPDLTPETDALLEPHRDRDHVGRADPLVGATSRRCRSRRAA